MGDAHNQQYNWSDVTTLKDDGSNPEVEVHEIAYSNRMYDDDFEGGNGLSKKFTSLNESDQKNQYIVSSKNQAGAAMANRYSSQQTKLNTIKGVFLPCFQNILGVILFIRLPFITAEAGIFLTLLIIFLGKLTTTLTTLSMSAIATNGTVEAGGPYFIISRNLGVELGGAIGTLFYLGTTIASSLYVLGAVEVIRASFDSNDESSYTKQLFSLILMFLITTTVSVGVKYVNMGASLFLLIVIFSIISIVLGVLLFVSGTYTGHLNSNAREGFDNFFPVYVENPDTGNTPTFYSLFALFFPSCTGIMAGCNRSAVLKNPGRSIPKGTLNAICVSTMIYVVFVIIFGCSLSNDQLINDKLVAMRIAWPTPFLVAIGIVAASLGAAMQCVTGASKLLAAIANDRTVPFLSYFAPKADEEPVKSVILTGLIATIPCMSGNLDYISAPITLAFLLMYASINLSCFVLCVLKSPGFRPQWRYYSWFSSLAGVMMCVSIMLIVSWQAAVVLIVLAFALLFYIKYQNATKDWGDSLTGFRYQVARDMLLSLRLKTVHAKNWRPQILVLCSIDSNGNPEVPELLTLASQMKKGRGLLMATALIKGDHVKDSVKAQEADKIFSLHLKEEGIEGFSKVSVCQDPVDAAITIMHHSGMGTMQPNSVLIAWPSDWENNSKSGNSFVSTLRGAVHAKKSVMVLKGGHALPSQFERLPRNNTVDIWWVAHDGGLLLLVPYLLSLHPVWSRCRLRLFSVIVDPNDDPQKVERDVREYLDQVRISAQVTAVDMSSAASNQNLYDIEIAARKLKKLEMCAEVGKITSSGKKAPLESNVSDNDEFMANGQTGGLLFHLNKKHGYERNSDTNWGGVDEGLDENNGSIQFKRKMTSILLNRHMHQHSRNARLVVTNFPLVRGMSSYDVLKYVENITENLAPVLMIRGTGQEVITQFG
eukprot:CAMPEP_0171472000 /NCGR_PEP_ID=MMETSP0946-20130122/1029_1 /TAXON_ID=109269 /ORGANISM="Vaucheria litorea, Strain CCMP2940" /LENGTH=935 /DNA_ID=CAMNT_0012001577 /DNA_START=34 /DNA_END=2837 /DNA_ORIENTATION=+